jgi:DNA-binding response OmpR family regulator
MSSISVLLVEDDTRLGAFTADYLTQHGLEVTHELDGVTGFAEVQRRQYDAVVLDLMLPGRDGLSVCRAIREKSDVPVLLVTARTEEADRVLGLESGADDYVPKPYSPRELLARIRAVVRRDRGELKPQEREWTVGRLTISPSRRSATLDHQPLPLTSAEFDLLVVFMKHPGRVLSREQLLRLARGTDSETFDRAIDVQVSRLRHKLGADAPESSPIRTVRGVGYMLAEG